MNIEVKGRITEIKNSEAFGNFEKRTFWVEETEGQYPNTYKLEAQQGMCNVLDKYYIGDEVECNVDVQGRKFTSKKTGQEGVINTLKCWKINKTGSSRPRTNPADVIPIGGTSDIVDDDSGLPF